MSGNSSGGSVASRRAILAKAATGLAVGGGALLPLTAGESWAAAATVEVPWLVQPSNDPSGGQDVTNVLNALTTYGVAWLWPGTYYANATVTAHEGQYVRGMGQGVTLWNMTTGGFAAFEWTPANPASYSEYGHGGITGVTIINQHGLPGGNPADDSIGLRMGDIVHLECDVEIRACQTGALFSNQYYWTERAEFTVRTWSCTNPVIFECATSGGNNRSGSFDRTRFTWFASDFSGPGGMVQGVQLINGAQFVGGAIRIYGNIGGTGVAGVYALYISGSSSGPIYHENSSLVGCELTMVIETSITTTPPGTIYLGSGNYILAASGTISCWQFGTCTIAGSQFEYFGAIDGSISSGTSIQKALWHAISSGFPPGVTGIVRYKRVGQGDEVMLDVALTIAASTTLTSGQPLFTLPSGFYYTSDNKLVQLVLNATGSPISTTYHFLNSAGAFSWGNPTWTSSSQGPSYLYGQATYATRV